MYASNKPITTGLAAGQLCEKHRHKISREVFPHPLTVAYQRQKVKAFHWLFSTEQSVICLCKGVGGTVASESALRFARTLLSRVLASSLAPWLDGGPESLRSP
ncbi:hypothetical protein PoB_002797100 [Plakobranchus ocellatus]|uniref:Uncharacterized protein n=1 Tax=Plakobranchus ocellatus TaxID=259542 RepID=A0AAV3ZQY5_9GAST|nr:hypothetical protein PoB_002797100 [Plakobranchus ocellatus]